MNTIIMYIENAIVLLIALTLYLNLVPSVFPRLTLKPAWKAVRHGRVQLEERGVRKLVFPEGRANIYEPAPKIRRFIHRYALIKQDGCVYIKCRLHDRVAFIHYDVAAFDRAGHLLDVLSVNERILEQGHTRMVRLPRKTSYVSLTLRKVDKMYLDRSVTLKLAPSGVWQCVILTALATMGLAFVANRTINAMLAPWPFVVGISGLGVTLVFAAIFGVLVALWMAYRYRKRVVKVNKK